MCSLSNFFLLTPSEQAAWVQAIGSIIAIVVAIIIPLLIDWRNKYSREVENKLRGKMVAATLLPSIYKIREKSSEFISQYTNQPGIFGEQRDLESYDSDYLSTIPEIIELLKLSPYAGAAQSKITQLVFYLVEAEENQNNITSLQRQGYHSAWINNIDFTIERAQKVKDAAEEVIYAIKLEYSN